VKNVAPPAFYTLPLHNWRVIYPDYHVGGTSRAWLFTCPAAPSVATHIPEGSIKRPDPPGPDDPSASTTSPPQPDVFLVIFLVPAFRRPRDGRYRFPVLVHSWAVTRLLLSLLGYILPFCHPSPGCCQRRSAACRFKTVISIARRRVAVPARRRPLCVRFCWRDVYLTTSLPNFL